MFLPATLMARLENQRVELLPFKRLLSLVFKYIDPQRNCK
jgi:hypothetical protein